MSSLEITSMDIAIIPARGGSVGLPGKNVRLLGEKPLIWYTIQAALSAKLVSRAFVSTDSAEIARYSESVGIEVLRHPPELSRDEAPTFPVVQWDLRQLASNGLHVNRCVVLRATTPLRTAADIDCAVQLLNENPNADSVVSVRRVEGVHPIRLKRILPTGHLVDAFSPEGSYPVRRQALEPLFVRNGGIYLCNSEVIESGGLWGPKCLAYVMPDERSVNINNEFDFHVAELLIPEQFPG